MAKRTLLSSADFAFCQPFICLRDDYIAFKASPPPTSGYYASNEGQGESLRI